MKPIESKKSKAEQHKVTSIKASSEQATAKIINNYKRISTTHLSSFISRTRVQMYEML